jgi:hypothetical protein
MQALSGSLTTYFGSNAGAGRFAGYAMTMRHVTGPERARARELGERNLTRIVPSHVVTPPPEDDPRPATEQRNACREAREQLTRVTATSGGESFTKYRFEAESARASASLWAAAGAAAKAMQQATNTIA